VFRFFAVLPRKAKGSEVMSWTTTLESALADPTAEDEARLIWLWDDPHLASFFARAFDKLTPAQQAAAASSARTALGLLPLRLQKAFVGFVEKIGMT
jgi:hypothetical protein